MKMVRLVCCFCLLLVSLLAVGLPGITLAQDEEEPAIVEKITMTPTYPTVESVAGGDFEFLMDLAVDEGFARAVAEKVGDHLLQIGLESLKRADAYEFGVWIFDDMCNLQGPMFSPRTFERIFAPYIVASQSVPVVAIAPLLVIWFGPGLRSKVLICALIVFFPVLINTIVGLRSVPDELRDLMRSLQATSWQTFQYLEVPSSLPVFLGGVRIGATLAVIGAVVGEFVGADRGLGFLINIGRGQYDTALVFVAIFTLVAMALALYGLVVLVETRLLSWQQRPGDS